MNFFKPLFNQRGQLEFDLDNLFDLPSSGGGEDIGSLIEEASFPDTTGDTIGDTFASILRGLSGAAGVGAGIAGLFGGNPRRTTTERATPTEAQQRMFALDEAVRRANIVESGYDISTDAGGNLTLNRRAPTTDDLRGTAFGRQIQAGLSDEMARGRTPFPAGQLLTGRQGLIDALRQRMGQNGAAGDGTGARGLGFAGGSGNALNDFLTAEELAPSAAAPGGSPISVPIGTGAGGESSTTTSAGRVPTAVTAAGGLGLGVGLASLVAKLVASGIPANTARNLAQRLQGLLGGSSPTGDVNQIGAAFDSQDAEFGRDVLGDIAGRIGGGFGPEPVIGETDITGQPSIFDNLENLADGNVDQIGGAFDSLDTDIFSNFGSDSDLFDFAAMTDALDAQHGEVLSGLGEAGGVGLGTIGSVLGAAGGIINLAQGKISPSTIIGLTAGLARTGSALAGAGSALGGTLATAAQILGPVGLLVGIGTLLANIFADKPTRSESAREGIRDNLAPIFVKNGLSGIHKNWETVGEGGGVMTPDQRPLIGAAAVAGELVGGEKDNGRAMNMIWNTLLAENATPDQIKGTLRDILGSFEGGFSRWSREFINGSLEGRRASNLFLWTNSPYQTPSRNTFDLSEQDYQAMYAEGVSGLAAVYGLNPEDITPLIQKVVEQRNTWLVEEPKRIATEEAESRRVETERESQQTLDQERGSRQFQDSLTDD